MARGFSWSLDVLHGGLEINIIFDPFLVIKSIDQDQDSHWNQCGSTTLIKMFINLRSTFFQVPFNHPLFIMYSSGTTGAPKCMVHSVGGTLLKHLEEHVVQGNRDHTDVLLYYTTTGRHWRNMWCRGTCQLGPVCFLLQSTTAQVDPYTWTYRNMLYMGTETPQTSCSTIGRHLLKHLQEHVVQEKTGKK